MKCAKIGCGNKGEWAVEAHLPAKGWAIEAHKPITIICDMPLCRDHASEASLIEAMPDLRQTIREVVASAGLVEPDFDRAWTTALRRSSAKFVEFERQRSGRSN